MALMAFVTRPWHVFALRAALGFFTGYGGLTLSMAAESAPRDRMAAAIGTVQTAQRLGPAVGPVIGGVLAGAVGLRRAFLVTALLYTVALLLVLLVYQEQAPEPGGSGEAAPERSAFDPCSPSRTSCCCSASSSASSSSIAASARSCRSISSSSGSPVRR